MTRARRPARFFAPRSCRSSFADPESPLPPEPDVVAITRTAARPKTTTAAGARMRSGLRYSGSIAGRMVHPPVRESGSLDQCPGGRPELLRGVGRGPGRFAAALAVGVDDRARGGDEARRGVRGER